MSRRKTEPEPDSLLAAMRRAILLVLDDPTASVVDRTRAIEAGTKILAMEFKAREREPTRGFFAGRSDE